VELRGVAKNGATVKTATLENVELGDVVVLAVWYGVNLDLVKKLGNKLAGKTVVDIANPLNSTFDGLATAPDTSSAEEVAKVVPANTKVVKAFNTTFAGTLVDGQVGGQKLDVFIAGDDEDAKAGCFPNSLPMAVWWLWMPAHCIARASSKAWVCWGSPYSSSTTWVSPPVGTDPQ